MPPAQAKDAFLSHNSSDKPAVEELARRLDAVPEGISCWLDKWDLIPGETFQEGLLEALSNCGCCVVFVGAGEISPWQTEEIREAISRRAEEARNGEKFRVIPVLLPGARRPERGQLSGFLVQATWVEFRESLDEPEPFHRLKSGILGIAPGRGPGDAVAEGQDPYRGLEVFQPEHAKFFFGRDADIGWAADGLRESRFLAIVGASGSGKSSLARAGLVPALRNGALPGSESWPIVILRPGSNPLESLAVRLAQNEDLKAGAGDSGDLQRRLLDEEKRLHLAIRQAIDYEDDDSGRAVLIVDQFEEMFTLCESEELRRAFIANLLYAATVTGGPTVVVLTMRADFYPKCAAYPGLAAALSDNQVLLGPMTRDSLHEVIERPAQMAGCEFQPGLAEMLLDDMEDQPPGALPLLEHCLRLLWERREGGRRLTVVAYKELGRIEGALEKHAEGIFQKLSGPEQETCARLFIRLVRLGEGSADTRRQVLVGRAAPDDMSRHLVEVLAGKDARLLTSSGGDGRSEEEDPRIVEGAAEDSTGGEMARIEITHEALIANWGRLRRWIEDNRKTILVQQRLEEDAREWDGNRREVRFLHSGARLKEGREWVMENRDLEENFPVEFAFVRAGRKRAGRRLLILISATVVSLCLGMVAVLVGVFALFKQQEAGKAKEETQRITHQLSEISWREFELKRRIRQAGLDDAVEAPSMENPKDFSNGIEMELVWCRPGEFMMGSPEKEAWRDDNERLHKVNLTEGFWIGRYEVTQAQWKEVMGENPSHYLGVGAYAPVEQISWEMATEFCRKLTELERKGDRFPDELEYTLPTEGQWEYACRAGTTGLYNVEEAELEGLGWYLENAGGKTHPIGEKRANGWGLYDMHGNVFEWCRDFYGEYEEGGVVVDPTGPESGVGRVVRGGSWTSLDIYCRSADREVQYVESFYRGRHTFVGFRVAVSSTRPTIPKE